MTNCLVVRGEKTECAIAEFALVSLAVLGLIEDMFGHHFAHHVGIARSSQPIA